MRRLALAGLLASSLALPAWAEDARFPTLTPEQMTPAQRAMADSVIAGPRGRLAGPFNAWLRSPEIGERLQQVGAAVRYKSSLPRELNEFAILIVAREWTAQYEWHAHHRLAMEAGLPAAVAADLAQGRKPRRMSADQALVYEFCMQLHRDHRVSDPTFNATKARFGEQGVIDLIAVSGYYVSVSMTLNTAQTQLPSGVQPPLPILRPRRS
jgi:4-carboxymuconolactone decarboxylase